MKKTMTMQEAFEEACILVPKGSVFVRCEKKKYSHMEIPTIECTISAFVPECEIFRSNTFSGCVDLLKQYLNSEQTLPTNEEIGLEDDLDEGGEGMYL